MVDCHPSLEGSITSPEADIQSSRDRESNRDLDNLVRKQSNRYRILKLFYECIEERKFDELNRHEVINYFVHRVREMNEHEALSAFDYLIDEKLLESIALGGETRITHQGKKEVEAAIENPNRRTEHFSEQAIQVVIREVVMGDKFEQISNSTIVNRSLVQNAFNRTKEEVDEETADALLEVAQFVEESQDVAAGALMNQFTGELKEQQPDKSKLKQFWDGLIAVLPGVVKLADATAKITQLFA